MAKSLFFAQSPGVVRSHPDREFAEYILSGLEHGFRIGFDYQTRLSSVRQNMPAAAEHPEVVERHSVAGRILGPIAREQLPGLKVNRFGSARPPISGGSSRTSRSPTVAASTTV